MFFGLPDPDPLVRVMDPDPALDREQDPTLFYSGQNAMFLFLIFVLITY